MGQPVNLSDTSRNRAAVQPEYFYQQPMNPPMQYQQPMNPPLQYQQPMNPAMQYQQPMNPAMQYQQPMNPAMQYQQPMNPGMQYQQPMNPGMQQQNTTAGGANVVVNMSGMGSGGGTPVPVGERTSIIMNCFTCKKTVKTVVELENGKEVMRVFWILFAVGFFVGITWFFCCIPCCITSLKRAKHTCEHCQTYLGYCGK